MKKGGAMENENIKNFGTEKDVTKLIQILKSLIDQYGMQDFESALALALMEEIKY